MNPRSSLRRAVSRRPVIATRCPRPMTAEEERLYDQMLRDIQEDMRSAGGFQAWLETRLERWVAPLPRCSGRSVPRRLARR